MGLFDVAEGVNYNETVSTTMQIEGKMNECSVVILVATSLSLRIEQGKAMGVKLDDGHRVTITRQCRGVELQLGNS